MSPLGAALIAARQGLRARRRRVLLTALGIALASAMLTSAAVVSYGLGTGFDRAARAASLPDIIVRFDDKSARTVAARIAALPDVSRYSLRLEVTNVGIDLDRRRERRGDAVAEVIDPGPRRGYAIVAGRDLLDSGSELLVERAFADAWGVQLGDKMDVRGLGPQRVVGFVQAPDNVGFPLAKPRFYVSRPAIDARFGQERNRDVNLAEIWLANPRYLNEVLVQARAASFGLRSITFATRSGVRILLDQAAGIVIDLLVALSLIALVTAGVMLAASARAEVQRRLGAIGVRRAVGTSHAQLTLSQAVEGLLVAIPAATAGALAGVFATYGPSARLLDLLNEPAPGGALALPLLGAWLLAALLPAAGAAWPVWRAGRRSIVELLRGGDVSRVSRARRPSRAPAGLTTLGARLVGARRARLVATALTLDLSTGFVLLMLALASALSTLETDPGALGKRYQLTATLPPSDVAAVNRIPGVETAAPRYEVNAADAFALGETINVIGFGGDHTTFEAPSLVSGRRLRGSRETEVGEGLAQALGLTEGSTLALALPSGRELRLRVVGIVSSLEHDGRVAYVPGPALLAADHDVSSLIAVRLAPGADQARVSATLTALGGEPAVAAGATARGAPLVNTLRSILWAVAAVDGLVCLYALIQACALTVQERRRTVAIIRACGAGAGAALGAGTLGLSGCGGAPGPSPSPSGSTLETTWIDPVGDAQLRVGPGEPLLPRVELGPRAAPVAVLATLGHVTDAHVLDASSPARVPFLDRLGEPFQSTFRPQEALTAQVLAGASRAVRALAPDLVIEGGDLIDNDQDNELTRALTVLRGGRVAPRSGADGYDGVQSPGDADPFYYRPGVDAPSHRGLLAAAVRPFSCPGIDARWCPVLGDHDALVAGELVPTALTQALAIGDRALWDLPRGVRRPSGTRLTLGPGSSPDGPPRPVLVDRLLRQALSGPTVQVPPEPRRRELSFAEVTSRLRSAAGLPPDGGATAARLDYVLDLGAHLRVIVLDLVRRDGGSGGQVVSGQAAWLERQLAAAPDRWLLVVSHQPLASSENGESLLALLDTSPHVIATIAGHTHRNRIVPRATAAGGYWQIATASLIDYPQQARALRVLATAGGGVAIQSWMLDHVFPGQLGTISRELSFLDSQGGRPHGFAGEHLDRNVTLHRGAP